MEINKSQYVSYCFTVKDNRKEQTDYSRFFSLWDKFEKEGYITMDCKYYEKDIHGRGHYHGIVAIKKGFYRKKMCPDGYHVKLDECYNRAQWVRYITKDQGTPKKDTREPVLTPNSPFDELIEDVENCCLKLTRRYV